MLICTRSALQARAIFFIQEVHLNLHVHPRALAEAQEVHMHDEVAHRIKLDIARNGAELLSAHFNINQ